MNEAEWLTRKNRIDTWLRIQTPPWKIIRYRKGLALSALPGAAVEELSTASGPADYALFVHDVLSDVKLTVNPQNILERAKRFSSGTLMSLARAFISLRMISARRKREL